MPANKIPGDNFWTKRGRSWPKFKTWSQLQWNVLWNHVCPSICYSICLRELLLRNCTSVFISILVQCFLAFNVKKWQLHLFEKLSKCCMLVLVENVYLHHSYMFLLQEICWSHCLYFMHKVSGAGLLKSPLCAQMEKPTIPWFEKQFFFQMNSYFFLIFLNWCFMLL